VAEISFSCTFFNCLQ